MKILYKFTVNKEIEVDEQKPSKDADGKEIIITSKVKKKEPHVFFIARPNRTLTEDGELFYNSIYWKCVKEYDIMPASQMQKRYLNDGGVLSEEQKKEYDGLYELLFTKQAEQLEVRNRKDKTDEDKKKEESLFQEIVAVFTKIQEIESRAGNALYQNTAESIARNRTAIWWTLQLSYKESPDGKFKSYFPGETYQEKLQTYDRIEEEENSFDLEVLQRLLLAGSLWYFGKAQTQDEFDLAISVAENKELINFSKDEEPKEIKT